MRIINSSNIETSKAHNEVFRRAIIKIGDLKSKIQTINEAWLNPNESFKPHIHPDCEEIYYIQKGTGELTINNIKHYVQTGDWIVIEQNEEHSLLNNTKDTLNYISIRTLV